MVHSVSGDGATYEKSKATVSPSSRQVNVSVKREFPPTCGRNAPRVNLQSLKDGGISTNVQKPKGCGHTSPQINAKPKEAVITVNPASPDGCGRNVPLVHPQPLKDVSVNGESVKGCGSSSPQINANPEKETAVLATQSLSVIRTFPDCCGRNAPLFNAKLKGEAVDFANQIFLDGCGLDAALNRTFPYGCGWDAVPISSKTGKVGVVSVTRTAADGGRRNAQHVGEGSVSVEDLKVETYNAFMEPSSVRKAFTEPTSVRKGGSLLELGSFEGTGSSHQNKSELLLRPLVPKNMNAWEVSFHSETVEPIEAVEPLSIDTLETQLFDSTKSSSVLKNNKHAKYPLRRRISASRDVPPPCKLNTPCSFSENNSFRALSMNAEKACGHNSGREIGRGDTDEHMENTDEVISANMPQEIGVFTEEIGYGAHVKSVQEAEQGGVEHVQVRESFENGVKQANLDSMSILSLQENTVSQLDPKSSSLKEKADGVSECSTEKLGMESGKCMRERLIVQGVMATANCPWSLGKVTCKSPNCLNHTTPVSKRKMGVHESQQLQNQESNGLTLPNNRLIIQALMGAQNCVWNAGKHNNVSDISHGSVERQGNRHEVAGLDDHNFGARRKLEKAEHKSSKKRKAFGNDSYGSAHEQSLIDEGDCSRHGKENCGPFSQRSHNMDLSLIPFGLHSWADKGDGNCDEDDAEEAVVTRKTVRETLRLFQGTYRKLLQDAESKAKVGQANGTLRVDLLAAKIMKDTNKCAKFRSDVKNKILGCVPGVEVGDEFHYRVELAIIGLHGPYQSGIDYLYKDGKALATSVVSSGGYDDVMDSSDALVYSGQGGIPYKNKKAEDQKLERGNLSLKNSYDEGTPVRVIRGYKETKGDNLLDSKSKVITTYVYDGLYYVEKYWQEIGSYGTQVFKFQLRRIPGQPELAIKEVKKSWKSKRRDGLCVEDISQGEERRHINAINTVDGEEPPPFKYLTSMIYPSLYNLTPLEGCQCTDGCSDSENCACAMKNGGEIPYNYDRAIVEAKPLVYECGPSCRCPPSCHNRVTQRGMKFQLEIFKTESRGWGVRSLNSIPLGSFICEYTGELLEDKEAELRTGNDEYLFDIGHNYSDPANKDSEPALARHPSNTASNFTSSLESVEDTGFTIDAAYWGSIGRFINHSCSPNCYAQNVLYDHDDRRMPHIMIFAAENIPPLQELAYHYNYEFDQVRDSNGNIKRKNCYCGSDDCTGRMY